MQSQGRKYDDIHTSIKSVFAEKSGTQNPYLLNIMLFSVSIGLLARFYSNNKMQYSRSRCLLFHELHHALWGI